MDHPPEHTAYLAIESRVHSASAAYRATFEASPAHSALVAPPFATAAHHVAQAQLDESATLATIDSQGSSDKSTMHTHLTR